MCSVCVCVCGVCVCMLAYYVDKGKGPSMHSYIIFLVNRLLVHAIHTFNLIYSHVICSACILKLCVINALAINELTGNL